ncbi:unnamed protein product [Phytomonas sp. Hart1]|nr:unnamed protein product [Phytomonas sp. Hart1]|eukprot:CCW68286.1 unnamed protein product [Phytomonas sp. isolate Hart1]
MNSETQSTSTEPKLIQRPKRKPRPEWVNGNASPPKNGRKHTPKKESIHKDPNHLLPKTRPQTTDRNLTTEDAVEGTEAFQTRIAEITSFRVVSRVRPFISEELEEMQGQERRSIVEMIDDKTVLLDPKDNWSPKAQFEFDASLWSIPPSHNLVYTFQDTRRKSYATQKDVYQYIAKDLVPHVFNGFNSCILSYGQTGSGKTYTMMGIYNPNVSCGGDGQEGIIPRVSNDLFILLNERKELEMEKPSSNRCRYRVEVTFIEIYMERVRDLLDPSLRNSKGNEKLQDARIRQDPYSGPFIEGVTKYQVENWAHCCTLLERGSQHRTTCATAVHNQSSRSHAIFQLTLVQEQIKPPKDRYSKPTTITRAGRINLVDLAGSERGGFQDYVKESAAINTSLLALRRVIDNLTERQNILIEQAKVEITGGYFQERILPQVPFRDSVLTWLLSDSIGGNARTTMVATVSPLVKNYGDTLATLQWSSKARNLVTLVKMNAQTMVQSGMANHVDVLGNAVQTQRNNLDCLRQTLREKQEKAERIEHETNGLKRTMVKNNQLIEKLNKERATLVVGRGLYRLLYANRLLSRKKHYQKLQDLQGNDNVTKLKKLRDDTTAKEEDAKRRLKNLEKQAISLMAKITDLERGRPIVLNQISEATPIYDEKCKKLNVNEILKRDNEEMQAAVSKARTQLDEIKQSVTDRLNQVDIAKAMIHDSKKPGWLEQIKKDGDEIPALWEKYDKVKQRHNTMSNLLQQVRAKHRKVYG